MLKELIAKQSLTLAFKFIVEAFKERDLELKVEVPEVELNLDEHFKEISAWAEIVSFKDAATSKLTEQIYVPLDIYLYPRKLKFDEETITSEPIATILAETSENIVLAGQPGAGKTTSMKWLCGQLLRDSRFLAERY